MLDHIKNQCMSLNNMKEGAVGGEKVPVDPRGGNCRVFYETTQGSGAVEKVGINWDDL